MHADTPSESGLVFTLKKLASPIVTLRVGPEKTILTAHKAILVQSKFFASCLGEGRFEEGSKNEIDCPEDAPEDMLAIVRYLYTGHYLDNGPCSWCTDDVTQHIAGLIHLYAIADKYCIDDMCEKLLRTASNSLQVSTISWSYLDRMKQAGLQGSKMWKVFVRGLSTGLHTTSGHADLDRILQEGLDADMETAMELLREAAANQLEYDKEVHRRLLAGNNNDAVWGNVNKNNNNASSGWN